MSAYDFTTAEEIAALVLTKRALHENRAFTEDEVQAWADAMSALVTVDLAREAVDRWYSKPRQGYERFTVGHLNQWAEGHRPHERSDWMGVDSETGAYWDHQPPSEFVGGGGSRYREWLDADRLAEAQGMTGRQRVRFARQQIGLPADPHPSTRPIPLRESTAWKSQAFPPFVMDALAHLDAGRRIDGSDW